MDKKENKRPSVETSGSYEFEMKRRLSTDDEYLKTKILDLAKSLEISGLQNMADYIKESMNIIEKDYLHRNMKDVIYSFNFFVLNYFKPTENDGSDARLIHMLMARIQKEIKTEKELRSALDSGDKDFLTGISNRGKFDADLKKIVESDRGIDKEFSLIIFDIDNFKGVNDTYGHDVGDNVLKYIASVIPEHIREYDGFYRIGGEEFAILVRASKEVVRRIAKEILADIQSRPATEDIAVTVSMGIASLKDLSDEEIASKSKKDALYKAADRAMYLVKRHKKNDIFQTGVDKVEDFPEKITILQKVNLLIREIMTPGK